MGKYDIDELRRRIGHLPEGLLEHVERVVGISVDLARRFGVDPEKAQVGALLHDVARATRGEELVRQARELGLDVGSLEHRMPIFLHGPVGAEIARRELGIEDEEVLEAIRCHTVGGAGIGPVARVVYLADKLDPSKDSRYPFIGQVRRLAETDLSGAILEFVKGDLSGLIARGSFIHPSTIEFRNELLAG